MSSAFQQLAGVAFATLDVGFGERLLVTHRIPGTFVGGVPDADNPAFLAIGILDVEGVVFDDSGAKTAARSEVVTTQPQVDFAVTQFGVGRLAPVKDCVITALDRDGAPSYKVLDALPSDDGRVVYQLAVYKAVAL